MHTFLMGVVLAMAGLQAAQEEVSFATDDNGVVYADRYGSGTRGVVLAHGARFDKASWKAQALEMSNAGYLVLAIDFRGYGKSHGGSQAKNTHAEMYLDILAAVRYLRSQGATSVAVVGGSMGGGAAANAVIKAKPGEIDRLVLLAHAPIETPEQITGPKLFTVSEGDPIAQRVREQYDKAPEPKRWLLLGGAAHAQFLFTTDQGTRLMTEILSFLSNKDAAAH
jgi:pimeloyl-ACP methyl ester carboxylesterase